MHFAYFLLSPTIKAPTHGYSAFRIPAFKGVTSRRLNLTHITTRAHRDTSCKFRMPKRGRKRKAAQPPVQHDANLEEGGQLLQPDPGNPPPGPRNIDFEEILRSANVLNNAPEQAPSCLNNENGQSNSGATNAGECGVPETASVGGLQNSNPPASWVAPQLSDLLASSRMNCGNTPEIIRTCGDNLAAHVPLNLKQQIGRGEYINLALLLKGAIELADLSGPGLLSVSSDGRIETVPKACKDKISNVEKWTDAFLIFASIYIFYHPDKAGEILQYIWLIRECAARQGGFAWREYDEQFRLRQALNPGSWCSINNDLWLRCVQVHAFKGPNTKTNSKQIPICFSFNKGRCAWDQCKFAHICSECSGPHSVANCQLNRTPQASSFSFRQNFSRQRGMFRGRGQRRPFRQSGPQFG